MFPICVAILDKSLNIPLLSIKSATLGSKKLNCSKKLLLLNLIVQKIFIN